MKNLKKRALALLVTALLLGATACNSGGGQSTAAPDSTAPSTAESASSEAAPQSEAEPVETESSLEGTLQLWHIHTNDTRKVPIENGVKAFEEANPGVKVEISIMENDPYKTKLRTVMGSGDAPDVFHSWGGGWLKAFVDEGLVMDMTEDIKGWEDQLSEAAIGMNTFDGKVWGSPLITSSTIMFYNTEMFERLGLEVPKTFEELEVVAETLKSNGIIPFALANQSKWPGAQHFVLLSMRIGGPDIFQKAINGEVSFEDPAFIQAGQMLQDMVAKGYFPEGANGINWDTGGSRMMMYNEQAAMIVQTSGFISTCKGEDEDFFNNKLGIAMYPEVAGGQGKLTDILGGENAFSVSSASQNKEAAIKLVETLCTSDEVQQGLLDGGSFCAKKGLTAPSEIVQNAVDQLQAATFLQNFIDQTLSPELSEMHKDTCQALFGNTMTPEQAAAEMQKLYESLQ